MRRKTRISLVCSLLTLSFPIGSAIGADAPPAQPPETEPPAPHPEVILPDIDMPTKGMSMKQVKKRFGEPSEIIPAVGDPPITRWTYKDFTVYFEGRFVIHSVAPRSLKIKTMNVGDDSLPLPDVSGGDEPVKSPFE